MLSMILSFVLAIAVSKSSQSASHTHHNAAANVIEVFMNAPFATYLHTYIDPFEK